MTAGLFIAAAIPSAVLIMLGAWTVTQIVRARKPVPLKVRANERRALR